MSIRHNPGRHSAATAAPGHARHARPGARKGRRRAAVAVGTVTLLGGGVALAAWSVSGQGQGDASAIEDDKIVFDAQPTSSTPGLYPGALGDVTVRLRNPLPYPVTLTEAKYGSISTTGACDLSHVAPVSADFVLLDTPISLPVGPGYVEEELNDAVRMLTTADDSCKGATFRITVTLRGYSS